MLFSDLALNCHIVSSILYRSAQPSYSNFVAMEEFGILSVVNLRSFHTDWFKLCGTKLIYKHIWMKAWHAEEEDIVEFLKWVQNPANQPVLVHCQHGADRTGTMCAMYRVVIGGWTKEQAIDEMVNGGFGFHGIFKNLVDWIENVDVDKIKKEVAV